MLQMLGDSEGVEREHRTWWENSVENRRLCKSSHRNGSQSDNKPITVHYQAILDGKRNTRPSSHGRMAQQSLSSSSVRSFSDISVVFPKRAVAHVEKARVLSRNSS